MRNNTCIICSTEFEPRAGKLYCSNACKQKGHADKKHLTIGSPQREEEIKIAKKQMEMFFPEFQEFQKKYRDTRIVSFLHYCFFRKNLTGVTDVKQVYEYIKTFDESFWDDFYQSDFHPNENSPIYKKYLEFVAKYFSDEFIISFKTKDDAKTN